jgi:2-hydroxy-3-keto-5-methylthiopentenyl-1-phosphate phosphatase
VRATPKFFQNTVAIVYDFDGTLSPQPMQEYTVLPHLGVSPAAFWREVNEVSARTGSDPMLTYMRLIIERIEDNALHVTREEFAAMAKHIRYFPGVEGWFERVNAYVGKQGGGRAKVQHYVVSAGQKEILEGVSIRRYFKQIYASEYHFNHAGVATFPKFLITDTMKTQFLFRVNKGKEKLTESINEHMPERERPIPFSNMIYIGDGMTDVPSMALTKKNGGHTIAVYNPTKRKSVGTCKRLLQANRVDFIAPADYKRGSKLSNRVELLLDSIIAGIAYQKEVFDCKVEHRLPT